MCVCVCVCVCVCMYVCVCVYMYICICMYIYIYVCIYVYVYVYVCMYIYVCVCVCIYMCVYVCACVRARASIYIERERDLHPYKEILNIEINIGTPRYLVNLSVGVYTDINIRIIKYTILIAWGLIHRKHQIRG